MANDALPTIDSARLELARTACYEVQVLAKTLRKFVEDNCPDGETCMVSRGILSRISDLSDIVYEAVINDDEEREEFKCLADKAGLIGAVAQG